MGRTLSTIFTVMPLFFCPCLIWAGEADVVNVVVEKTGASYLFDVTVAHKDVGWDHYTDKWEIVGLGDNVLATRTLHHPHVNEQPFTRGLSGVMIDSAVKNVIVRAHDSVHGYGGKEFSVTLPE